MIFSRSFILALVSAPFVVLAQSSTGPNAPKSTGSYSVSAGQPFTFEWTPTPSIPGTVSLVLRYGQSGNLNQGQVIASRIDNTGSYTWQVPSSEVYGTDYTIEIVSDTDPSQTNYSQRFTLESSNSASPSLSNVSITPVSVTGSSTAAPTPTSTGTHSGSSSTDSAASTTGTETASSTGTHSASSSMTTSARTSTQQSGLVASATPTTGGAARATAIVGMLGAVALGALAL